MLGSVESRKRSTTSTVLLNASTFGLRGYVDTLSPLVPMHLLDRSCVIVGIFLKLLRFPTNFPWLPGEAVGLHMGVLTKTFAINFRRVLDLLEFKNKVSQRFAGNQ